MLLSPNIHKSTIWSFKAQSMKAAVFILRPVMLYKDQTMLSHSVHFLQRSMKSAQSFSITSQHNKAKCVYGKNLSKIIKMKDYVSRSKLVFYVSIVRSSTYLDLLFEFSLAEKSRTQIKWWEEFCFDELEKCVRKNICLATKSHLSHVWESSLLVVIKSNWSMNEKVYV